MIKRWIVSLLVVYIVYRVFRYLEFRRWLLNRMNAEYVYTLEETDELLQELWDDGD